MSAFNYILQITGDCQSNNSGAISVALTGGTPPYTVEWTNPNLGFDSLLNELDPSVRTSLGAGAYAIRVNDSTVPTNNEFFINIPVSDGVCTSILATRDSFCSNNDGSVTATSTSDYSSTTYLLYSGNSSFVTSATTNNSQIIFNSLNPGYYYIVALDLGGCTGRSQNFIIADSNNFDYGLYVIPNTSCGGAPIGKIYVTGVTGTAPYTYSWSNGAITDSITGLSAGNYSVSVTDANGCSVTKSTDIVDVSPIGLGIFTSTPPGCFTNDGTLTMTVTGGTLPIYYSASTGYVQVSYLRSFTLTGLSPGDYSILATDAGLCTVVASTRLDSPVGFTSVNVVGQNSTCSANDGEIVINVQGGNAPYTYTLVGPGGNTDISTTVLQTQTFANLSSGTYTVIVSSTPDPLDPTSICSYTESIVIIAQDKFTITTSVTGTTCGNNNGIVQVVASAGGTLPYTYAIDGVNDLDGIFNNLSAGQHLVTVTDSLGCVQSQNVVVTASPVLDCSIYSTFNPTTNNGTITTFIGSGVPPFNFDWSPNVPGNPQDIQVTGLSQGSYSVTIQDDNGCSKTLSTQLQGTQNIVSLQCYTMGAEVFSVQSPTKFGLLQMLYDGYKDLTSSNTDCTLLNATYQVIVSVNPGAITTQANIPFTSTTLNQALPDNLYYDTAKNLIQSLPGVGSVTVDAFNNQITVTTATGNSFLNGKEIVVTLKIIYNIICLT